MLASKKMQCALRSRKWMDGRDEGSIISRTHVTAASNWVIQPHNEGHPGHLNMSPRSYNDWIRNIYLHYTRTWWQPEYVYSCPLRTRVKTIHFFPLSRHQHFFWVSYFKCRKSSPFVSLYYIYSTLVIIIDWIDIIILKQLEFT